MLLYLSVGKQFPDQPMLRKLTIASFAALALQAVQAQERCSAQTITQRWLERQGLSTDLSRHAKEAPRGVRKGGATPTIPVVVHVVWNTPAENVANTLISEMITTLNEDYQALNSDWDEVRPAFADDRANPSMLFCLAQVDPQGDATTGITRTQTSETWFDPENETNDMKSAPDGIAPWDPNGYLNIWICDISSGLSGGLTTAGYAYLPYGGMVGSAIDGIVIDFDHGLGNGSRTATHEVGHYLGLLHPWAEGGCGSDDGMDDTPVTDEATFTCSNTALMNCGELTQYENFMDYASCALMFTNDQVALMNGILNGVRAGLLDNIACGTVTTGPCIPTSLNGTSDGDYVDGVQLENISNTGSGGITGPSYQDNTSQTTDLIRGLDYTITVTSGENEEYSVGAWIDFDANDIFEADELLGDAITTSAFEDVPFLFTVPIDAALGTTRLRVRCIYPDIDIGEPTNVDPCFHFSRGETEDYSVNIGVNSGVAGAVLDHSRAYPNPADDVLYVLTGTSCMPEAEVLDPSGRVVARRSAPAGPWAIDVRGLANGRYLLRCTLHGRVDLVPFNVLHSR